MPSILPRVVKGEIARLLFMGTYQECLKATALTMGTLTEGKVSFAPDFVLLGKVLACIPNTQLLLNSGRWYDEQIDRSSRIISVLGKDISKEECFEIDGKRLYQYQQQAVNWMKEAKKCILRSERGLGKTVMGVCATKDMDTNLITCPGYLSYQWEEHVADWSPRHKFFAIRGKTKKEKERQLEEAISYQGPKYIATSYKVITLPQYSAILRQKYDAYIVDEAHRAANRSALQTKAIIQLAHCIPNVYFLTGSDLFTRTPETLWTMLNAIDPLRFSSFWSFFNMYIESIDRPNHRGKIIIGPKTEKLPQLAEVLAPIRLNQSKDEVGFQLPDKIMNDIWVDLEPMHRKLYNDFKKGRMHKDLQVTQGIEMFSMLRRLTNFPKAEGYEDFQPKTKPLLELVDDILEEGEKVLIFGYHLKYLRYLHQKLQVVAKPDGSKVYAGLVTGDTPSHMKHDIVRSFKESKDHQILIASIGTLGEGVNLQECTNVIFVELHWNPEQIAQCIDRCHRITSKMPINVYFILARNTVDTYMRSVLGSKESFISEANAIMKAIQLECIGETSKGEEKYGHE